MAARPADALADARRAFLARWGELGPAWGVNRTMSQIHALLMVSADAQTTDDVMAALGISRGNAHGNLQALCAWGLCRRVRRPGDRRDWYEAEKDVWRVIQCIARERKRQEIEPALATLDDCLATTRGLAGAEAQAFRRQLAELRRMAGTVDDALAALARRPPRRVLPWLLRMLR